MKKCLAMVAVCLMAAPAFAGDVSEETLSALGLGGMEVVSDADGMQVRGLSSNAAASGGSLAVGQLTYIDQFGQNFVVGTDVNTNRATAENGGFNAHSNARTVQGSATFGSLFVAPTAITPGFNGQFSVLSGQAHSLTGGIANAHAN